MIDGPIGGAAFNNEFGRPNLAGYFRIFELAVEGEVRGYHKPIMLAGGFGNLSAKHTHKKALGPGTVFIQLGGPGFLIGLGGGAASSMASGQNVESLDFDSVQRANAELERRCQEVIDACCRMGDDNPILSIHDVGAGGLSNAFPELAHSGGVGATFDLRAVPNEEPGMTPMQIWSNEAQERYVIAIDRSRLADFERMCERERCLFACVGEARRRPPARGRRPVLSPTPVDIPLGIAGQRQNAYEVSRAAGKRLHSSRTLAISLKPPLWFLKSPRLRQDIPGNNRDRSVGRSHRARPDVWAVAGAVADCAVTTLGCKTSRARRWRSGSAARFA